MSLEEFYHFIEIALLFLPERRIVVWENFVDEEKIFPSKVLGNLFESKDLESGVDNILGKILCFLDVFGVEISVFS